LNTCIIFHKLDNDLPDLLQGADGEITVAGVREVQVETQAELMDIIAAATQARYVTKDIAVKAAVNFAADCWAVCGMQLSCITPKKGG
jgi:hypothetical protein